MILQKNISSCRQLMTEVNENKSRVSQENERAKINTTFFDAYNNFLLPNLRAYVTVKEHTSFKFSDELVFKMTECLQSVTNAIEKKFVFDSPISFRVNTVKLRDQLCREWQDYYTEEYTNVIEDLDVLKLVYADKFKVIRIINSIKNILKWPVTSEQIEDYHSAMDEAKILLADMHFDPVIDAFLRKVKDKKATLEDLSDPIIKWIRENHFESSIQLIIT